jgi:hypothetical protein
MVLSVTETPTGGDACLCWAMDAQVEELAAYLLQKLSTYALPLTSRTI